jgi:DNA-binding beta-propeller fold protein YncE
MRLARFWPLALLLAPTAALLIWLNAFTPAQARQRVFKAPELEGAAGWLNTAGPLKLADLKGKIVILDFWTLCCINCIHILPDLDKLEKKYPNELVVIGVHTPKFDSEKSNESIRKAILRYEINHPVVNDAERRIWTTYGVRAWPTIAMIDPEGTLVYMDSGEGQYEDLDRNIQQLIKIHKEKKTLNTRPMKFDLARYTEGGSPLFFPGKVLVDADSKRIFIADSTHHRIVITDLEGNKIAIAGTGEAGTRNGSFAKAQLNDPQGMALQGDTLYVADRKNHMIRALNLKEQTVFTVAGTGEQGRDRVGDGPARKIALNSPWDLLIHNDRMFIAMAGHHQIWVMDLKKDTIAAYAGDGGEDLIDGPLSRSRFAQPSGLATNGRMLYVADSETSSIRALPMTGRGNVITLVGEDLFYFGDQDGVGRNVKLQHALGVAYHDGLLYVADTYNNKIKTLEPGTRTAKTWLGGESPGWLATPLFNEPGGLSIAGGKMYVADTNAHRIRVIDMKTKAVSTLNLTGVEAPKPATKE